ncbi:4458_t:CDS:1 [Cetraspora pellucida]|uniref:4458_t:CDS:1 n=1 Tax=Cetraspora pellucida TaxID=1433469 RepID=A0A9N9JNS9_9GLOM|nr:4458_t:CDS:1 [Cetraspora pellucida]
MPEEGGKFRELDKLKSKSVNQQKRAAKASKASFIIVEEQGIEKTLYFFCEECLVNIKKKNKKRGQKEKKRKENLAKKVENHEKRIQTLEKEQRRAEETTETEQIQKKISITFSRN